MSASSTRSVEVLSGAAQRMLIASQLTTRLTYDDQGLGTFFGVFVPTLATLFGVVIFLRLGEVVGDAGLGRAFVLLSAGFCISLLTTLSLCALVTNGPRIDKGGIYAALRKSVGVDIAAILGITFFMAYCIGISFYVYGFALSTSNLLSLESDRQVMSWNAAGSWVDVLVASVVLALLVAITMTGLRRSVFVAFAILVVIVCCLIVSMICLLCATNDDVAGYSAFSARTLSQNWGPAGESANWSHLLYVVFPGFTGVLAGANLSGDLRKPSTSIVRGMLAALVVAYFVYVCICFVLASTVERDRLQDNAMVIEEVVKGATRLPLLYVGIGATTLSSALSYLLGAPRIFAAIVRDDDSVHAFVKWFAVETTVCRRTKPRSSSSSSNGNHPDVPASSDDSAGGHHDDTSLYGRTEPQRALVLTWIVCQALLLTGELDNLSKLMTSTFLSIFTLINTTCLAMELFLPEAVWCPSFRLYSKWTALVGTVVSLAAIIVSKTYWFALFNFFVLAAGVVWKRHALRTVFSNARKRIDDDGASRAILQGRDSATQSPSSPKIETAYVKVTDAHGDASTTREALIRAAAEYVRDALGSRYYSSRRKVADGEDDADETHRIHGRGEIAAKRIFRRLKGCRFAVLCAYLCIGFVERPPWCGGHKCDDVPRFGIPELEPAQTGALELACLCFFAVEMSLKTRFFGTPLYQSGWHLAQLLLIAIGVAAILCVFVDSSYHFGVGLFVRPLLFVAKSRSVRSGFTILLKTVPGFIDALFLLFVCVVFGGGVGCVIFQDSDEGSYAFESVSTGINSMVVLLTTANYPDVMMPAYAENRLTSLFFVVYLVLGLFLMLNLVLATICDSYRVMIVEKETDLRSQRAASLDAAFRLLCRASEFDRRCRRTSSSASRQSKTAEDIDPESRNSQTPGVDLTVFAALQLRLERSASSGVTLLRNDDAFETNSVFDIPRVVLTRTYPNMTRSVVDRRGFERLLKTSEALARQRRNLRSRHHDVDPWEIDIVMERLWDVVFCDRSDEYRNFALHFAEHSGCTLCLDALSLVNVVLVYCSNDWQANLQIVVASVYVVHVVLLVLAGGFKCFFVRKTNVFDLVVTILHFGIALSLGGADYRRHTQLFRIVLLLRLFRGFRAILRFERFKIVFDAFMHLIREANELLGMMMTVFFLFAAFGEHLFGGMIYETNPHLNGTAFAANAYWPNNFNDFGSSLVTLFELLVVNNWHIIMDGFVEASGTGVARLFFYAYYVVAVVVVLNLVVAYIVANFGRKRRELLDRRRDDRELRKMTHDNLGARRMEIVSANLGQVGMWTTRIDDEEDDVVTKRDAFSEDAVREEEAGSGVATHETPLMGSPRRERIGGRRIRSSPNALQPRAASTRLYAALPIGDVTSTLSWLETMAKSTSRVAGECPSVQARI